MLRIVVMEDSDAACSAANQHPRLRRTASCWPSASNNVGQQPDRQTDWKRSSNTAGISYKIKPYRCRRIPPVITTTTTTTTTTITIIIFLRRPPRPSPAPHPSPLRHPLPTTRHRLTTGRLTNPLRPGITNRPSSPPSHSANQQTDERNQTRSPA